MSDDFRINPNSIRPPIARPGLNPAARPAPTLPLDAADAPRTTAPLDRARFGHESTRGLADPLPSLARVGAILDAAPVAAAAAPAVDRMHARRPDLRALSDDAIFVQGAFREALGRAPSRDELERGLSNVGGDRQAFLENLVASPEFAKRAARVDAAFQAGTPMALNVTGSDKSVQVLWPYPEGSRNGGPGALSTQGDMERFRDYMAPFANYFGAGTRGSQMQWVGEQGKNDLFPGSEATRELGAIAQTLFWDVPMQQNSDATLRTAGISPDLSRPEAMAQYLTGQRDRVAELVARQDPAYDGAVHRAGAQELLDMLDAAVTRAQAFVAGDRSPMQAVAMGGFGVYNTARPLDGQLPTAAGPQVNSDPKAAVAAADAKVQQNPASLGPDSFHQRLSTYLLGY